MISAIRKVFRTTPFLRDYIYDPLRYYAFVLFNFKHRNYYVADDDWDKRIENVLISPDNEFIETVPDAGQVKDGYLLMHNGIKIKPLSYYGDPVLKMLSLNKGIHEPQEERVFQEVLKRMPEKATMIELGCYWAFYSMWFQSKVKDANCYLVEPVQENLEYGKENFGINGMNGNFFQGFAGAYTGEMKDENRIYSVDGLVEINNIPFVDILHSDIQGAEYDMLKGAEKTIKERKVGYIFISTHSNKLHEKCLSFLMQHGFVIISSVNLFESFSLDGLIVARASYYPGLEPMQVSVRKC